MRPQAPALHRDGDAADSAPVIVGIGELELSRWKAAHTTRRRRPNGRDGIAASRSGH